MINEINFNDNTSIDIPPGFTVFCDMDGTLVDSDYVNFLSYKRALVDATCGMLDIEFADERFDRDRLKKKFPSLTIAQLENIIALKEEYFFKFIPKMRLNAALANLISNYCEKNRLVLVTGCRKKRAVEVLKHHNLLGCFTRLICCEDTTQSGSSNKYESAIKLIGVRPDSVFIFEDDDICIEEAVRAGVPRKNIQKIYIKSRDYDE